MSSHQARSEDQVKLSKIAGYCEVCGEPAFRVNYGALTCLSCRTFFRRNALNSKDIGTCSRCGNCKIDTKTRKFCPACRLTKCFSVGMSTDFIRKEYSINVKKKLDASNNSKPILVKIPQESPLDRPADGTYITLENSDRLLISNVVHAFDAFTPTTKINLESFISSTPDFKILTSMEQRSLFQRNSIGLLAVNVAYLVQESGLFEKIENESGFLVIYGAEIMQKIRSLIRQFHYDPTLMKLIMIALTFSSNCYMVDNCSSMEQDTLLLGTFRLYGSQNFYTNIIWRYLVHKYNFNHAVQIFSKLIKHLLDLFSIAIHLYGTNKVQQIVVDDVMEKTRTSSNLDRQVTVSLWGKQQ